MPDAECVEPGFEAVAINVVGTDERGYPILKLGDNTEIRADEKGMLQIPGYPELIPASSFAGQDTGFPKDTGEQGEAVPPISEQVWEKYLEWFKYREEPEDCSLKLRIQFKDVAEPEIWRDVILPGNCNFYSLSYAVRATLYLEPDKDSQFCDRIGCETFIIYDSLSDKSTKRIERMMGVDYVPVTAFLSRKGDMIEMLHNFESPLEISITVLDVLEGKFLPATIEGHNGENWQDGYNSNKDIQRIHDCFKELEASDERQKDFLAKLWGYESADEFYCVHHPFEINLPMISECLRLHFNQTDA